MTIVKMTGNELSPLSYIKEEEKTSLSFFNSESKSYSTVLSSRIPSKLILKKAHIFRVKWRYLIDLIQSPLLIMVNF